MKITVWSGYEKLPLARQPYAIDLIDGDVVVRINVAQMRFQVIRDGDVVDEAPFTLDSLVKAVREGFPRSEKKVHHERDGRETPDD